MRKTLIAGVRPDNRSLVERLSQHFDLIDTATAVEQVAPVPYDIPENDFPYEDVLEELWPAMCGFVDAVLDCPDLAGVLVWNSMQRPYRAMCLAARKRGLPAFEVDHGCFATYLHGHFEVDPAATHIFASPEHASFLRANGCKSKIYETGRPQYDTWRTDLSTVEARARANLPAVDGPLVLATTTWHHNLSAWSDPAMQARAEGALIAAMKIVQEVMPCAFCMTLRSTDQGDADLRGELMEQAGLKDFFIVLANEAPLSNLLSAADVVVSPKGSAAAEAVIADKPAIILDFHPQLDAWAWEQRGIIAQRSDDPKLIAESILRCLVDEELREDLAVQRKAGRLWFNGPGNAAEAITQEIVKACYSSQELQEHSAGTSSLILPGQEESVPSAGTNTRRIGSEKKSMPLVLPTRFKSS